MLTIMITVALAAPNMPGRGKAPAEPLMSSARVSLIRVGGAVLKGGMRPARPGRPPAYRGPVLRIRTGQRRPRRLGERTP